jgi:hypothetical protein
MAGNTDGAQQGQGEHRTLSGLEVKQLYTQDDLQDFDHDRDLGVPGAFPFTRGPYPDMYRVVCGPGARLPALAPRGQPTSATGSCWSTAKPASALISIIPR